MGRTIYLTDEELSALRDSSTEWCEIMSTGDSDSEEAVKDRLENGLGSALKKLYKGLNGERIYKNY